MALQGLSCSTTPVVLPVFALALVVGLCLLFQTVHLHFHPAGLRQSKGVTRSSNAEDIHVCLCSDDTDLQPAFVSIRSAWAASSEPERLVFHYITTARIAVVAQAQFAKHLPGIRVKVHHNSVLEAHIKSTISFRKSSKARKVLASPFNFAPFYLHRYLAQLRPAVERPIYLDTDTLIMGDLTELHEVDLRGHPCAAVSYCLQRFQDYINFDQVRKLGYSDIDPTQCIANRGVMVIDRAQWTATRMTEKIEHWLTLYRDAAEDLWYGGMSQPPWLLAMNGDYKPLGDEWNCNSLGRMKMSRLEFKALRKLGLDKQAIRMLGVSVVWNGTAKGSALPFVVTCSEHGKLLHYNGAVKPWEREEWLQRNMWPVCALPQTYPDAKRNWTWNRTIRVRCREQEFVACPDLWANFISAGVSTELMRISKELERERMELRMQAEERKKKKTRDEEQEHGDDSDVHEEETQEGDDSDG